MGYKGWPLRSHVCLPVSFSVQLGFNKTLGPVNVYTGYTYRLVCADSFDDNAARVVCRELDFAAGEALYPSAFGQQTGSVGVTHVRCTGDESRFEDCAMEISSYRCASRAYASVVCATEDSDRTGMRLFFCLLLHFLCFLW